MYCTHCGVAIVPAQARFCWNCGASLGGPQGNTPQGAPAGAIETCDIVVMVGSLNKGFFQANVKGPDNAYIAGKSNEFAMLSSDQFWLNQTEARAAHEKLLVQLQNERWEKLGTTSQEWWSTTLRRAIRV